MTGAYFNSIIYQEKGCKKMILYKIGANGSSVRYSGVDGYYTFSWGYYIDSVRNGVIKEF